MPAEEANSPRARSSTLQCGGGEKGGEDLKSSLCSTLILKFDTGHQIDNPTYQKTLLFRKSTSAYRLHMSLSPRGLAAAYSCGSTAEQLMRVSQGSRKDIKKGKDIAKGVNLVPEIHKKTGSAICHKNIGYLTAAVC